MRLQQFLIFEICKECNLGAKHGECPNRAPERYGRGDCSKPMTDEMIIDIAERFYNEFGFTGFIGWHYYNEPLLAKERVLALMVKIKARVQAARFVLWTNGTLLPADCQELSGFGLAWVTNYDGGDYNRIRKAIPKTKIVSWGLDARVEPHGGRSPRLCGRIFSEFIFDYFGNVHICCIDWRREVEIGNAHIDSLELLVARFQNVRRKIAGAEMADDAPELCLECKLRHNKPASLVPEISTLAVKAMRQGAFEAQSMGAAVDGLAIICRTHGADIDEWRTHHEPFAKCLKYALDDRAATTALQQAKREGCYFGLVLKVGERLQGSVKDALRLHPDENFLRLAVAREGEAPHDSRVIVRLSDFRKYQARQMQVKRRVKVRALDLQELSVLDTLQRHGGRVAVTFTHYRVPEKRLHEHFRWNDKVYRAANARVFVVTDREYADLPDYASCIVYPDNLDVFNLSATSNFGIRYAAESGFHTIIKTDCDMVIPPELWPQLAGVQEGSAIVPHYLMASSYDGRETDYVAAPKATGTIAMVAQDWRQAHYHEECVGYGSDDAIMLNAIKRQGINIDRVEGKPIYHIAHQEGTPQKEFCKKTPRVDHWGRDNGFNPENFGHNRKFYKQEFASSRWGLASLTEITIVIVHYRMPKERLLEFFDWNDSLFREFGARVIVVSDIERTGLPDYARLAVFPDDLDIFNLSRTSNYGIRLAGSGIICKTDPDCVFSPEAMAAVAGVTQKRGVCMRYLMAQSYEQRDKAREWQASKGTVALHYDHWNAICGYDERHSGYGIEDGDCFHRATQAEGREVERIAAPFWHIAHSQDSQPRGNQRPDCWNRGNGFNPKNHRVNKEFMRAKNWHDPAWGIA